MIPRVDSSLWWKSLVRSRSTSLFFSESHFRDGGYMGNWNFSAMPSHPIITECRPPRQQFFSCRVPHLWPSIGPVAVWYLNDLKSRSSGALTKAARNRPRCWAQWDAFQGPAKPPFLPAGSRLLEKILQVQCFLFDENQRPGGSDSHYVECFSLMQKEF